MTLYELIEHASAEPITETMVMDSASELQISVEQLFDEFAKIVAKKYTDGEFSWGFSDVAMNNLFSYAYVSSGNGLSSFAFRVFEAFD